MPSYCQTSSLPNKSACISNRGSPVKRILREIVAHYKKEILPLAKQELRFFADQPSLKSAIHAATMCEYPKGKRHDHQTRIPHDVLKRSYEKLRRLDFSTFHDFDSLHSSVKKTIAPIHGMGPLTVYDIAHRIGAFLGLEPKRV